jgi:putative PIN family toxin of toxin-antitoxin system
VIIVLDTNALVQVFGARSPFLPLQRAILDGRVALAFSTAILLEYEEVLTRYGGPNRWPQVWRAVELTGQIHDNLRRVEPAYHWRLIVPDPDDDKFVDCAIAAEAEWVVTEDRHLDVLKHSGHKPQPISPAEFIQGGVGRKAVEDYRSPGRCARHGAVEESARFWSAPVLWRFGWRRGSGSWLLGLRLLLRLRRGSSEEVRAVLPVRLGIRPESQPRLMHERRGLERVAGRLARHLLRRDPPQLGVHQLEEPTGRRVVARAHGGQDLGDVTHAEASLV